MLSQPKEVRVMIKGKATYIGQRVDLYRYIPLTYIASPTDQYRSQHLPAEGRIQRACREERKEKPHGLPS